VPLPLWGIPQQAVVWSSGLGRGVVAPRSARADPVLTARVVPEFTPCSETTAGGAGPSRRVGL
jgi:hypothetical protein